MGEFMINAKCTNCGANLEVDENQEAGICRFCNSAYITEKAIQNFNNTTTNNSTNNAQTIVNNYYNSAPAQPQKIVRQVITEPRPKIKIGLAIILFFFYIFPGFIYILNVKSKQEKWDKKYGIDEY